MYTGEPLENEHSYGYGLNKITHTRSKNVHGNGFRHLLRGPLEHQEYYTPHYYCWFCLCHIFIPSHQGLPQLAAEAALWGTGGGVNFIQFLLTGFNPGREAHSHITVFFHSLGFKYSYI